MLAVRYDIYIYIYIYMSLGGRKVLHQEMDIQSEQVLETLAIPPRNQYSCAIECEKSEKTGGHDFLISDVRPTEEIMTV